MRLISALIRLLCGAALLAFAAVKYVAFREPIARDATIQLFNRSLSAHAVLVLLTISALVGALLVLMGLLTLRKKE